MPTAAPGRPAPAALRVDEPGSTLAPPQALGALAGTALLAAVVAAVLVRRDRADAQADQVDLDTGLFDLPTELLAAIFVEAWSQVIDPADDLAQRVLREGLVVAARRSVDVATARRTRIAMAAAEGIRTAGSPATLPGTRLPMRHDATEFLAFIRPLENTVHIAVPLAAMIRQISRPSLDAGALRDVDIGVRAWGVASVVFTALFGAMAATTDGPANPVLTGAMATMSCIALVAATAESVRQRGQSMARPTRWARPGRDDPRDRTIADTQAAMLDLVLPVVRSGVPDGRLAEPLKQLCDLNLGRLDDDGSGRSAPALDCVIDLLPRVSRAERGEVLFRFLRHPRLDFERHVRPALAMLAGCPGDMTALAIGMGSQYLRDMAPADSARLVADWIRAGESGPGARGIDGGVLNAVAPGPLADAIVPLAWIVLPGEFDAVEGIGDIRDRIASLASFCDVGVPALPTQADRGTLSPEATIQAAIESAQDIDTIVQALRIGEALYKRRAEPLLQSLPFLHLLATALSNERLPNAPADERHRLVMHVLDLLARSPVGRGVEGALVHVVDRDWTGLDGQRFRLQFDAALDIAGSYNIDKQGETLRHVARVIARRYTGNANEPIGRRHVDAGNRAQVLHFARRLARLGAEFKLLHRGDGPRAGIPVVRDPLADWFRLAREADDIERRAAA